MEGLISKKLVIFLAILLCFIASFFVLAEENNLNPFPAINYAPNFWFDSQEQYYPANPLDFYYENGEEINGEIAVQKYNQLSIQEKLNNLTIFYHIEDEGTELVYQYWFFYVFNDNPVGVKNEHYGDWEAVYVFVDKDSGNVNKVIGTAHQREIFDTEIDDLENNHAWTYIGNGSHANCVDSEDDGYCNSLKWKKFEKWDGNGEKVLYNSYNLSEITSNFISNFNEANTLEKSSVLGINIFDFLKIENKKLYIPVGGSPPTHAWEQSSYYNPEEIRPYSIKYALEKVDQSKNKIVGFFNNLIVKTGTFFKGVEIDEQQVSAIIPPVLEPNRAEEEIVVLEESIEIMPILEPEPEIAKVVEEKTVVIEEKIEIAEENIIVQPEPLYKMPFMGIGAPPPVREDSSAEATTSEAESLPVEAEDKEIEPEPEPEPPQEPEPEPEPEIIIDDTSPSSISDLSAEAGDNRGEINLSWTAPGDDDLVGTSTEYFIKYSTSSEITSDNWASSTDFVNEIVPSVSGSAENLLISGLDVNKTYYWAIRSKDEVDNFSEISNCASISPQAKADSLVISEVQIDSIIGSGGASDDFIELYNPTDSDIYLNEYRLVKRTETGISDTSIKSWSGDLEARVPAHGFYLWANSGYAEINTVPDITTTATISPNNGIALRLGEINAGLIVDSLGWGDCQNEFVEKSAAVALLENQSLERKNIIVSTAESLAVNGNEHWQGNNRDSNDNKNDFVLQSNPNPQNSLTLTEPRDSFAGLADTAWPMLQHDLRHTGLSSYGNNATGTPTSTPKWMVSLGLNSLSSPVIDSNGYIYVGRGSELYKVSPDGQFELFYDAQTSYAIRSPVIDSSGNFYFTDSYNLYALTSDGELIWKYSFYSISSEPVISLDGVIYIADSSYLYALTPNGEIIWQSEQLSDGRWVRSPVIDSNGIIYTVGKFGYYTYLNLQYVYAINPLDGTFLWLNNPKGSYSTALSIDNEGTIFVGGYFGLYAIDSSDGSQKWHGSTGKISYSIPAIIEDTIYVGADNHAFYKVNKSDGRASIILFFSQRIIASPIIDNNGVIYIGGLDKMFYAINPDKTIKWQAKLSSEIYKGAVIGSDGTVYIVTLDGNLYAFGE